MGLMFFASRKTPMSNCSRGCASEPQESTIVSRAQSTNFLDNKLHASYHSSVWIYHYKDKSFVGFWGYVLLYWHQVCTDTQHSKQQNNSPDSSWSDRRSNALFLYLGCSELDTYLYLKTHLHGNDFMLVGNGTNSHVSFLLLSAS